MVVENPERLKLVDLIAPSLALYIFPVFSLSNFIIYAFSWISFLEVGVINL